MAFCTNCGNQLKDWATFCTNCGQAATWASENQSAQPQNMYEEFSAEAGTFGAKKFVITNKSLIYGSDEYSFDQLSQIRFVSAPIPLGNGVAQVTADGKVLTLAYKATKKARFDAAMSYANEQINTAHGNTKRYKYIL